VLSHYGRPTQQITQLSPHEYHLEYHLKPTQLSPQEYKAGDHLKLTQLSPEEYKARDHTSSQLNPELNAHPSHGHTQHLGYLTQMSQLSPEENDMEDVSKSCNQQHHFPILTPKCLTPSNYGYNMPGDICIIIQLSRFLQLANK
jgi:hypothetical protein